MTHHATPTPASRAASSYSFLLHLLACALVLGSFSLITVGGNVTSLDAGMAVPDWPGTFGYNMFLAPLEKWGPHSGGAFWEHLHRLMGSAVGFVSIGLAVALWVTQRHRPWLRWYGFLLLGLVIVQGLMGGFRVSENSQFLAAVHGVFGQLFLAMSILLAAATGSFWAWSSNEREATPGRERGWRWELGLFGTCVALVIAMIFLRASHSADLIFLSRVEEATVIAAMAAYVLVALWRVLPAARRAWPAWAKPEGANLAAAALLATLVLQLILGAAVRHGGAEHAIPDAPLVYGGVVPPLSEARFPTLDPEPMPGVTVGLMWLHYGHRVAALFVTAALVWAVAAAVRRGLHPAALPPMIATVGLTILQITLGLWTVWSEVHPSMATMHQACGAALLASTTWLTIRIFLTSGLEPRRAEAPAQAGPRVGLQGEPA